MIQIPYHWTLIPALVTLISFWWALRSEYDFGVYARICMTIVAAIVSAATWLIFGLSAL